MHYIQGRFAPLIAAYQQLHALGQFRKRTKALSGLTNLKLRTKMLQAVRELADLAQALQLFSSHRQAPTTLPSLPKQLDPNAHSDPHRTFSKDKSYGDSTELQTLRSLLLKLADLKITAISGAVSASKHLSPTNVAYGPQIDDRRNKTQAASNIWSQGFTYQDRSAPPLLTKLRPPINRPVPSASLGNIWNPAAYSPQKSQTQSQQNSFQRHGWSGAGLGLSFTNRFTASKNLHQPSRHMIQTQFGKKLAVELALDMPEMRKKAAPHAWLPHGQANNSTTTKRPHHDGRGGISNTIHIAVSDNFSALDTPLRPQSSHEGFEVDLDAIYDKLMRRFEDEAARLQRKSYDDAPHPYSHRSV